MRMTATSGYALRVSVYLFMQDRVCSSNELSRACGIAQCYVAKLARRLKEAGIVDAVQGPLGGYRLACDGRSVTVDDLMCAVDDRIDLRITANEWERDSSQMPHAARVALVRAEADVKSRLGSLTVAELAEPSEGSPARAFEPAIVSALA